MIPNIEDLTEPPIVGKFYMVPCVEVSQAKEQHGHRGGIFPVTGPKHEDAEIVGFPPHHWHYDFRFFDLRQWAWAQTFHESPFNRALCVETQNYFTKELIPNHGISAKPTLMRRRCHRLQPEYPGHLPLWRLELPKAYAERRVTCGKCPHRGLPLLSLPREPGTDIVTCPGHGLRWDLKTGALVRPSASP